jgi:GNAT superfamily N-acetyltransferase
MTLDRVRVAVLERADSEALLAMLGRCSPETLYRRFHGVTDGTFYADKVVAAAAYGDSSVAWNDNRCVGLGNLHLCDDTADVGVLVEDAWQRRGVGTALLIALLQRIRERGSQFLRADVLEENRFALRVLSRHGSATTSIAAGSYTILVDLGVETLRCQNRPQPTEELNFHQSRRAWRRQVGIAT